MLFFAKFKILVDHGRPCYGSQNIRHLNLLATIKFEDSIAICDILIKMRKISKFHEMVHLSISGVHGVFSLTLVLCQGHGSLRVSGPALFASLKVFHKVNGLPVEFLLGILKTYKLRVSFFKLFNMEFLYAVMNITRSSRSLLFFFIK